MENTSLPALKALANERDFGNTKEFATAFNAKEQTVRKNFSRTGECYGIRPVKVGNKLLWPFAKIAERLQGGVK